MCVYVVFFLDFKRLLACTLNLVIGHLVPPPKMPKLGGRAKKNSGAPPKPDLVATPLVYTMCIITSLTLNWGIVL